jgi:hypothetical protein
MRVLVIVKATKESEAGVMPSEQLLTEMGQFNEELVKAGVMQAGEGLPRARRACGSASPASRALSSTARSRRHRMGQTLPEPLG